MTKLKKLMHGALASEKRLIALCYALFFCRQRAGVPRPGLC